MFDKNIFFENVKKSKNFLIIGANKADSNDDLFLVDHLEYCVLIEPIPKCVDLLKNKYKDDNRYEIYDYAISENNGIEKMITIDNISDELIGSSSLQNYIRNNIIQELERKNALTDENFIYVKTIKLNDLKNKFKVKKFDLIQIDTEGCDKIIFDQLMESNIEFLNIKLETMWLNDSEKKEIHKKLLENNFNIYDDGCNLLAFKRNEIL